MKRRVHCIECDAPEGKIHEMGCLKEVCPQCGGQRVTCPCMLPPRERRVPYIRWPNVCERCGRLHPASFIVQNEVWTHYIEPKARKKIVCLECWNQIIDLIDGGQFAAARGGVELIDALLSGKSGPRPAQRSRGAA